MIFWDGEKALPEQAGNFKRYLKNYMIKVTFTRVLMKVGTVLHVNLSGLILN